MSEHSDQGRHGTAIGNAITRLHREHYGRGATSTRTVMQRNFVAVLLDDIYTPVERTLIDAGDRDVVRQTRQAFQLAMTGPFSTAVEEITGRKVIAFMSQVHFEPDMAVEAFILEPTAAEISDGTGG
jgi:uncharacterized protein YbcI